MSRNATLDLEISVDCYATFERVEAYIPWVTLNSTTRPSKKQALTVHIRDNYDLMNGMLKEMGYVVPIPSTNATSVAILGKINAMNSAASIDMALRGGNSQVSQQSVMLYEQQKLLWKDFSSGKIELPDAEREGAFQLRENELQPDSRFYVDSNLNELDPVFNRKQDY
tara:strand:+ start:2236 stop:2739 length:504 start_codon:yes stop_codon:yes gene_type:complete